MFIMRMYDASYERWLANVSNTLTYYCCVCFGIAGSKCFFSLVFSFALLIRFSVVWSHAHTTHIHISFVANTLHFFVSMFFFSSFIFAFPLFLFFFMPSIPCVWYTHTRETLRIKIEVVTGILIFHNKVALWLYHFCCCWEIERIVSISRLNYILSTFALHSSR